MLRIIFFTLALVAISSDLDAQHSIAREWNEALLESIRNDFARPTVHARNLFHSSLMMYDIWTVVTGEGEPYLLGDTINNFLSEFDLSYEFVFEDENDEKEYIEEAISYAMFDLLRHRFIWSPDYFFETRVLLTNFMEDLGYDPEATAGRFPEDSTAVALGRFVATEVIRYGLLDGANEAENYRNLYYQPVNAPTVVSDPGLEGLVDPNRWQPLAFDIFIDQSGNEIVGNIPEFLGPEWGNVIPFALSEDDLNIYEDDAGNEYRVYKDPGPPPLLDPESETEESVRYKEGFALVAVWSSMLDPEDGVIWDISPATIGNIEELPGSFDEYDEFYDLNEGGDASRGHAMNPVTGQPYEPQMVPRGDYARVLAEFWADGPDSETPPGHWFTILHQVMDHPMFERKWQGGGAVLDTLEYDVKAFFTLGGAMHDAAVSTWSIKGWYDYIRPFSAIRYMASKGQSSDEALPNYDIHGIPLIPGRIELVMEGDTLAQIDSANLGKIKLFGWRGPDFIDDPETDVAGVGWILAERWWPYQRPSFVSPPFAGYTSGHSCFSRAAAEVLTFMTGDEFFPGGVGIFPVLQNEFLVFEDGPSIDMELQWATYRDASDQTSLSRIWGGIHPPRDDIPGRVLGIDIGIDAFNKATSFFSEESTSTFDENLITDQFHVTPNLLHSTDRLRISRREDSSDEVYIQLFDYQSRLVRSEKIRPGITTLDIYGLNPGPYILHLIDQNTRQVEKVIIVE